MFRRTEVTAHRNMLRIGGFYLSYEGGQMSVYLCICLQYCAASLQGVVRGDRGLQLLPPAIKKLQLTPQMQLEVLTLRWKVFTQHGQKYNKR